MDQKLEGSILIMSGRSEILRLPVARGGNYAVSRNDLNLAFGVTVETFEKLLQPLGAHKILIRGSDAAQVTSFGCGTTLDG